MKPAGTSTVIRAGAAVAAAALVFAACSGEDAAETGLEELIESQGGGEVDLDLDSDGGISIETEDGSMTIDEDGNFVVTDDNGDVVTGNVDEDGGVDVQSEDGSFSSATGSELPDGWPGAVPEPDGLEIEGSSSIADDASEAYTVVGVPDGDDWVDDYGSALESAGFALDSEFTSDGAVQRQYTGSGYSVSVGVFSDDAGGQATVSVFSE